ALETKAAASESKIAALEATLKGVTRSGNMITFSGVNVKIDNGLEESQQNGLGNLFMGYNVNILEKQPEQTGSHNIVLGKSESFTSHGDIIVGFANKAFGNDSMLVGAGNTVTGPTPRTPRSHVDASASYPTPLQKRAERPNEGGVTGQMPTCPS